MISQQLLAKRIAKIKQEFSSYVREYKAKLPSSTSYDNIKSIFQQNVVEVIFKRRVKKEGYQNYRRMLCTADWDLIVNPDKHINARKDYFKWKPPIKGYSPEYWKSRKLIIVWDLLQLHWRTIPIDDFVIVSFFPLSDASDKIKLKSLTFGGFYRKFVRDFSQDNRDEYSNRINENIKNTIRLPKEDSLLVGVNGDSPFNTFNEANEKATNLQWLGYDAWVFDAGDDNYYVVIDNSE